MKIEVNIMEPPQQPQLQSTQKEEEKKKKYIYIYRIRDELLLYTVSIEFGMQQRPKKEKNASCLGSRLQPLGFI